MSMSYKKLHQRRLTYIPKDNVNKHKHNYSIHCILEITNKNIHASANYYNKKEYYNVLKCEICNSFIPNSIEGNISGNIIDKNYNRELPLIVASTNMKNPAYDFNTLYDVSIK